jgi:ankyrin repeat protein
MIYRKEFNMIYTLLNSNITNKEEIIEELDHRGNTPLLLAAKLSYKETEYIRIAALLMHHGANTRVKDADGWTIIDEATEKQNGLLMGIVFDFMYAERTE